MELYQVLDILVEHNVEKFAAKPKDMDEAIGLELL